LGCFPRPPDRDEPVSTSLRTSARTPASALFSVCSDRMVRARSSDRPELIIVANCRDMTARSFSLTLGLEPGSLISVLRPPPVLRMLTGA
jgi:hypothetical protein